MSTEKVLHRKRKTHTLVNCLGHLDKRWPGAVSQAAKLINPSEPLTRAVFAWGTCTRGARWAPRRAAVASDIVPSARREATKVPCVLARRNVQGGLPCNPVRATMGFIVQWQLQIF
jgi:hypothetical protein